MKLNLGVGLAWGLAMSALGVPTITSEPIDQSGAVGSRVTFRVIASAVAPPLSYQWHFNETDLAGKTGNTLESLSSEM